MESMKPEPVTATRNERIMAGLMYILPMGQAWWSIFILIGLLSHVVDLPYYIRFHYTQSIRMGVLALPLIAFFALLFVSVEVLNLEWLTWISFALVAINFVVLLTAYFIGAYFGFTGKVNQLIPGQDIWI